jgi:ParB-like chromosome segregation protein Spo0J
LKKAVMESTIRVQDIDVDPTIQPRLRGIDPDHVRALEESFEACPPIAVVRSGARYLLADGFHRLCAAQNLGPEAVEVRVVDLAPGQPLWDLAFELNAVHGRPLSLADRRAFGDRLLHAHPELSDRELARRCGLSSNTVGALRAHLETSAQIEQTTERVGRGGHTYEVPHHESARRPGDLPEPTLTDALAHAISGALSSSDRRNQRSIVTYLQRLSIALEDQFDLDGWDTHEHAAEACRLVLGEEKAQELADRLGPCALNVYSLATELGYEAAE